MSASTGNTPAAPGLRSDIAVPCTPEEWFSLPRLSDWPSKIGKGISNAKHVAVIFVPGDVSQLVRVKLVAEVHSQLPVICVTVSDDTGASGIVEYDFETYTWAGASSNTENNKRLMRKLMKTSPSDDLPSILPAKFGLIGLKRSGSPPEPKMRPTGTNLGNSPALQALCNGQEIWICYHMQMEHQWQYFRDLVERGQYWYYKQQLHSGYSQFLGGSYDHQAKVSSPTMSAPAAPTWLRSGGSFVALAPKNTFHNKKSWEMTMKLAVMWEAKAAEATADSVLDVREIQEFTIDSTRSFGNALSMALTVRQLKGGNPMAQMDPGENVEVFWSNRQGDTDTGVVTRGMFQGQFSFTLTTSKTLSTSRIGDSLRAPLRLMVNHEPARRELVAISKAVLAGEEPTRFRMSDIIHGLPTNRRVSIRNDMPENMLSDIQDLVIEAFKYNKAQEDAFRTIMGQEGIRNGLAFIQGAPGTGKSYFIGGLIITLAVCDKKVGLFAQSNGATDTALRYVIEHNNRPELEFMKLPEVSMVRANSKTVVLRQLRKMGTPQGAWSTTNAGENTEDYLVSDPIQPYLMANVIMRAVQEKGPTDSFWRDVGHEIRVAQQSPPGFAPRKEVDFSRRVKDAIDKICGWDHIRVVASTLSNSATLGDFEEDVAIIDEATRVTEPSFTIAGNRGAKLMVMVGDHKQLPPTVLSKTLKNNIYRDQLELSLFERLINNGWEYFMLTRQYRMHPDISKGPNQREYQGKLENDPCTEAVTPHSIFWEQFVEQHHSLRGMTRRKIMIDHNTPSERPRGSHSFCNERIANMVNMLVDELMAFRSAGPDAVSLQSTDIAVVTPYLAEKHTVLGKNEYSLNPDLAAIPVSSIDGYAGKEARFIILDLSGPALSPKHPDKVGFLGDERRINVGLTRAKIALIIVGDFSRWQANLPALRAGHNASKAFAAFVQEVIDDGATIRWEPDRPVPSAAPQAPLPPHNLDNDFADLLGEDDEETAAPSGGQSTGQGPTGQSKSIDDDEITYSSEDGETTIGTKRGPGDGDGEGGEGEAQAKRAKSGDTMDVDQPAGPPQVVAP
ncbi:hypothetical protein MMC30_000037 [Trapelia coarctata]|nr:hypothetical protein [Trapelia coarctata]